MSEPEQEMNAPSTESVVRARPQTSRAWPDLIVDRACLDQFHETVGTIVADHLPLPLDVSGLLASTGPSIVLNATAVVFGVRDMNGEPSIDLVERLRVQAPHVGIYVVASGMDEVKKWLPRYAAAGLDEVICHDAPILPSRRSHTLRQRLAAPAPETEIRLLWRYFRDLPERALVMHCVRNGFWFDDWVLRNAVFAASRKTLQNRLSAFGLPSPGLLARCGRMLHAQELERRGFKPADTVADVLGFPSAPALQRARRRLRRVLMAKGSRALVFVSLLR